MTQPMPSLPGMPEQIARYQLLSELGRGSMGHVYLALDPNIDRKVALKIFLPLLKVGAAEQWELRQRFVVEARAAGRLHHPGIVTIFDADTDTDTGLSYLAMEWVNGPSLDDLIRESAPLTVERSTQIVQEVAEALHVAHRQGLVHRDIKPANILLESGGRAKVTDFGIAKLASMSITTTGWIPGSPFYMSPEQIRNDDIDRRSDLYALGAVLYQCLTGRLPFEAESLAALTHMILEIDPRPVRSINPQVSPELAAVIDAAMAKSPDDRFDSGREFARALELAGRGSFEPLARAPSSGPGAETSTEGDLEPCGGAPGTGTIGLADRGGELTREAGTGSRQGVPPGIVDQASAPAEAGSEPAAPRAAAGPHTGRTAIPGVSTGRTLWVVGALLALVLVAWGLLPVESEPSAASSVARLFSSTPSFSEAAPPAGGGIELPTDPVEETRPEAPPEPHQTPVAPAPAAEVVPPVPDGSAGEPGSADAVESEPPVATAAPEPSPAWRPRASSTLEIVYRNRLKNAVVSVFIDEVSAYSGTVEAQNGIFGKAFGKNVWTALELTPGEHVVDVRITGADGKADMVRRTTAVFEPGRTHRLRVSVTPLKKIKLAWKDSPGG